MVCTDRSKLTVKIKKSNLDDKLLLLEKNNCAGKLKLGLHSTSSRSLIQFINPIGDVMISVLASSMVNCGFEPRSGQTTDYNIGICCFSAKHATLRSKEQILGGSESR